MGEIKKVLSSCKLVTDPYFYDDLRIEVSEAIHIHWRDTRLLLKPSQFAQFANSIRIAAKNWDGGLTKWDTVLDNSKIPDGVLFNKHISIEEQVNGCVHFHYNDVRIEMTMEQFYIIAKLFKDALLNTSQEVLMPLSTINPYDHIHFPTKEEWLSVEGYSQEHLEKDYNDHLEGIDWMVKKILFGYQIEPILITSSDGKYTRRDGYKRFKAYEQLGYKCIPCYIVSEEIALTCPQDNQYPFRCK